MGTHGRGSANHKLADFLGRAKILCRESNPERDPYAELGYAIVMQALVDWLRGQEKIQKEYGADNLQELRTKFPSKEELAVSLEQYWLKLVAKTGLKLRISVNNIAIFFIIPPV